MTTAADALQRLQRSEADLEQARAILACLADASMCPPEWVDEFDRLRQAQYTSSVSVYQQLRDKVLEIDPTGTYLARWDAMVPAPRMVPGLAPRHRNKVEAKRSKGKDPSRPDYADLLVLQMGIPKPKRLLPIDAELVAAEARRETTEGYGDPGEGAGSSYGGWWLPAAVAIGVVGLAVYYALKEDPATAQLEIQTEQYHEYLGVVGPMLSQIASGMESGALSTAQAASLIGQLQRLCPAGTLPNVPGASVCGLSSCFKWFAGAATVAALLILVGAWTQGYFKRVGPGEARPELLPSPERVKFWRRKHEPPLLPPARRTPAIGGWRWR